MSLYLRLFGAMRLVDGERVLNPAPLPKCASLLAYLALNAQRFVTRKEVAFKLWPDDDEEIALGRLRRHLHELVNALPPSGVPWILADRANVGWNAQAPWTSDVAQFERWIGSLHTRSRAVELYDGTPAEDLDDVWLEPYRRRYRDLAIEALEALCAQAWLEHDAFSAIAHARRLLRVDPLRERTVRRLMAMLQQTGDRAAALHAYAEFAALLRAEIGEEPMPQTRAAFEAARAGLAPVVFPNNLPAHLTPFIGREHAVCEIARQLGKTRLLTLTGPGGAGKTRLALAAATFLGAAYEDGVYFIDLAGATDARSVAGSFCAPFGAGAQSDAIAALVMRLRDRRALLVADNCEHVLDACGPLCERLLRGAAHVTILATSRMPLRLHGEALYEVPALCAEEARELFVSRSHAAVSAEDCAAVDAICARLDGLPLAIELAAAATGPLGLAAIHERVIERDAALEFASRTGVQRHRTLDATIAWSIALLSDDDRDLFESLSPFTPSFTPEAAAEIRMQDVGSIQAGLARLQEASMLQSFAVDGSGRFRLLDTIRAAALARLRRRPDCDALHDRHAECFAGLVAEAQPHFRDEHQAQWLAKLDAEQGNLEAALRWSFSRKADFERAIAMVCGLRRFWEFRGHYAQAEYWLERALAHVAADARERVEILATLGKMQVYAGDIRLALERCAQAELLAQAIGDDAGLTYAQAVHAYALLHRGDRAQARRILETVEVRMREEGDEHGLAGTLGNIAFDDMHNEDFTSAKVRYEAALAIFERFGDRRQCGWMLYQLGRVALCQSDFTTARTFFERSLEIRRAFGDRRGIVETLCSLGEIALAERSADRAEALFAQGYRLSREIGWRRGLATAIEGRAAVAALRGNPREAAQLIGAADAYRQTYSLFIHPADRIAYEALLERIRGQLGTPAFEEAAALGRSTSIMRD